MMGGSSQEEGPDANGAGARDNDKNDNISSDHTAGDKNNGGNDTGRSMSSGQMAEDSSNNTNENDGDNTLWDQMTAREGRDDARRAGMRTGDWQAEMQLQEALRESRQEADPPGVASVPSTANSVAEEERSFVDAGFHALATSAVEEDAEVEEEEETAASTAAAAAEVSPHRHRRRAARRGRDASTTAAENDHVDDKSAKMYSVDVAAAAAAEAAVTAAAAATSAAAGDAAATNGTPESGIGSAGRPGAERECGDDEDDFDDVELIVTQDGGIIPVAPPAAAMAAVAGGGSAGVVPNPGAAEEEGTSGRKMARKGGKGGAGSGVGVVNGGGGGAAAVRKVRKSGIGKGTTSGVEEEKEAGQQQKEEDREEGGKGGEEEEEEEEEEMPLPPDIVLTLPDDVLHRTMLFLHPEDILECRAVSSRWEFPGDEAVFEGLCRRTYLAQSAKKLLNVDRWRSWQRMFKFRPRLRDTGLYSLKTTYFKKPVRDMCTEWTPGKVLKVTYYRYFRFFGDGRVAYGLTHESPKEFVRMLQEGSPKVVYGTYTISKWEVNVEIPNPWSWVNFTLQLANGERGRFTHLVMLRHSSVPRNDTRVGRCNHKVKSSDFFTFRRVWQF